MDVEFGGAEFVGAATLGPRAKLLRFLYIGNDKNVVISQRKHPISIDDLDNRLNFIKEMAAIQYSLPFSIIKNVMVTNTLHRNDEAILSISFCLRRVDNIKQLEVAKLRADIYKSLPELMKTDSDMFLFVYLSNKILNDVGAVRNERTGFGRGMKKALRQWYEHRSAEELANVCGRNRGMYGWTHRDIIHMCHMKFGITKENEKATLLAALHKHGSGKIKDLRNLFSSAPHETWPKPVQRILRICELKVTKNPINAVEMIHKIPNFEIGHLPVHLISKYQIWEMLIQNKNYRELMKVLPSLQSLNMLQANNPISEKVSKTLKNKSLIKEANIHPLEVQPISKLYEKNKRYNEYIKSKSYQKLVMKRGLVPNPTIIKKLKIAVDVSLNSSPQTGCDYFIALDLRQSAKKRTVLRMNQVTCLEAMVLLALSIRKLEKNTKIYSFSENENIMSPVKLNVDMNFEQALSHCEPLLIEEVNKNLSLPFQYVNKTNKNTVFIIFDSAGHFSSDLKAPIDEFRLYREKHPDSKFIILSLRRSSGNFEFNYEKGFLEICGLNSDTWRIIQSFASNSFT